MKITAQIILAIVALFITINGLGVMFLPAKMAAGLEITPEGILGLSNMRGMMGGAITAVGLSVAIAAVKAEIVHARPAVLFVFGIFVGRIAGLLMDGFDPVAAKFLLMPVLVFGLLLTAHKLLDKVADQR